MAKAVKEVLMRNAVAEAGAESLRLCASARESDSDLAQSRKGAKGAGAGGGAAEAGAGTVIAELRERLRGAVPQVRGGSVATGVLAIDALLGGGFPEGRLVDLVGGRASCATSVAVQALAAATRRGEVVAYIDWPDAFDPRSAAAAGLELARTLWVRPKTVKDAFLAVDLVLGAGGFGVVVMDLFGEDKRNHRGTEVGRSEERIFLGNKFSPPTSSSLRLCGFSSSFLRLARGAEKSKTTLLVITEKHVAGTFAALTLACGRARVTVERSRSLAPGRAARVVFLAPRIQ